LKKQIKDSVKLGAYLDQVVHDVLENLELFKVSDTDEEVRREALSTVLSATGSNLWWTMTALSGAAVHHRGTTPCFRSPVR